MQIDAEAEGQASSIGNGFDGEVQPSSNEGLRTKKIIVQLSEGIFERLEAAAERPGIGKSMVVETALQRFLAPAQGAEGLIRETLDRVSGQMARLERASETDRGVPERRTVEELLQEGSSAPAVEGGSEPRAAAEEGGSKLNFRSLSSSLC
ncbi:hypothetical protein IVB38_19275 [Bradyrhizobium sp. 38]|uniref:hypothetical protein n=1 Tax=unclassified Bradyrhizobium TaxID=2631580 RepID=UPI001FF754A0|nr:MULTISPECIES: hypothetical protein [unclassified Bradyrhizobium]MCK1338101.1 hypothetical protein [Bradyrhizobium sp. 38]MCK1777471.1 hypothetical protein [Bradyrhizobium sp. 132]